MLTNRLPVSERNQKLGFSGTEMGQQLDEMRMAIAIKQLGRKKAGPHRLGGPTKTDLGDGTWKDRFIRVIRTGHYALRTEETYLGWIERYARFVGGKQLEECGVDEVAGFLDDLAVNLRVSAASQKQALNALVFLYGKLKAGCSRF